MIEHFTKLGVTAVELMPVHHFVHDDRLVDWACGTTGATTRSPTWPPTTATASRPGHRVVNEFKAMVRALHAARIEVILDVVYNHTAEGNHLGPTLASGASTTPATTGWSTAEPRFYSDSTGTGNTLNVRNPHVLQLMMDSLRYWVLEMHVDGFRFDLAASLARQFHEVDRLSAFFDLIQQDPVISQVKLIAEPWDLGDGGYQVGNFPAAVVGMERQVPRHRPRLLAPERHSDRRAGRAPHRQLRPLRGHRPAALRQHQLRHLPRRLHPRPTWCPTTTSTTRPTAKTAGTAPTTTGRGTAGSKARPTTPRSWPCAASRCATSWPRCSCRQGVPMLLGGDELGRTQRGNNNAYCQDNEISWYDWDNVDEDLLAWTTA